MLDLVEQVLIAKRFLNEVNCSSLDGRYGHGHVSMCREKDYRESGVQLLELLLQLETTHAGHANVQHQTARPRRVVGFEEVLCRGEDLNVQTH
jgi:hypothetical protein